MPIHELDTLEENRPQVIDAGNSWLAIALAGIIGTLCGGLLTTVILLSELPALV
jgi:hypothetical protein